MLQTFEVRWFCREQPLDLDTYFSQHTELQERTDWYAMPCTASCGIKIREGKLETKLRCATLGVRDLSCVVGRLESFKKWSLEFSSGEDPPSADELSGSGWLNVDKKRYLQRYEVADTRVSAATIRPVCGCEFEMTQLRVQGRSYWTVGFEAVGPFEALEENLRRVSAHVFRQRDMRRALSAENSLGYAEWLRGLGTTDST